MKIVDWDGPKDDFCAKHSFWFSSCMERCISRSFDQKFKAKLRELEEAGIDIDKLPEDMKLFVVVGLTVEEARRVVDRRAS